MKKHKSLADGLRAWLTKPEGPIEPVKTNWSVVPANDNESLLDMHVDRQREIVPSIAEIMREAQHEPTRNAAGQIVAIGKLQFSDGAQTERAYANGPDGKVIRYDARAPAGAMLYTRERLTRERGPAQTPHVPAGRLAEIMGVEHRKRIPATRQPKGGKSYTSVEAQADLDAAIANTPVMPAVTKCPPGLPAATDNPADSFVGMKKGKKGESGAIAWEDISSSVAEREMWEATLDSLPVKDRKVLDAATKARNVAQVGASVGFGAEYSRRKGGMRALLAANENLRSALNKSAA